MHGPGLLQLTAVAIIASALPVAAKAPGQVHCYGKVCHRVLSVAEVRDRVGRGVATQASYYDSAERDRFNAGLVTSSGEVFDADSPHRVASSIYPDGTELLLWNPRNGRASHVRVNDFGPFYAARTLDVTRRIAEDLGFVRAGVIEMMVIVVAAPSPSEARYRRGRSYSPSFGYIGRFNGDDLDDLSSDLVAAAAARRIAEERIQVADNGSPLGAPVAPAPAASLATAPPTDMARSAIPAASASSASGQSGLAAAVSRTSVSEPPRSGSGGAASATDVTRTTHAGGTSGTADTPAQPTTAAATRAARFDLALMARTEHAVSHATTVLISLAMVDARRAPRPALVIAEAAISAVDQAKPAGGPATMLGERIGLSPMLAATRAEADDATQVSTTARGSVVPPPSAAPSPQRQIATPAQPTTVAMPAQLAQPATVAVSETEVATVVERTMAALRNADWHGAGSLPLPGQWSRWLTAGLVGAALLLLMRDRLDRRRRQRAMVRAPHSHDRGAALVAPALAPTLPHASMPRGNSAGSSATIRTGLGLLPPASETGAASAPSAISGRTTGTADIETLALTARRQQAENRLTEAEATLTNLIARIEASDGPFSPSLADHLCAWADCARDQGRLDDARSIYARALTVAEVSGTPLPIADILDARALLALRMRQPQVAFADANRALGLRTAPQPPTTPGNGLDAAGRAPGGDPDIGVTLSILGEAYRIAGDLASAEYAHREALGAFLLHDGAHGLRTAGSMTSLARVLVLRPGGVDEARSLLLSALPLLEGHLGLRHAGVAQSHATLADIYQVSGDIEEAVRLRRQSLDILSSLEGPQHPDVVEARQRLASLIGS